MIKIVDSGEMSAIDTSATDDFGIPAIILMENAGIKSYQRYCSIETELTVGPGELVFVAGKGNNGGDAFVMARQAHMDGRRVSVVMFSDAGGELTGKHKTILNHLQVPLYSWNRDREQCRQSFRRASAIFDGLFGTGLKGKLREDAEEIVQAMNGAAPIVALDVPSGTGDEFLPDYPSIQASVTLTMGLPKKCLYLPEARKRSGTIHTVPIGFPPELVSGGGAEIALLDHSDISGMLPPMREWDYKSSRGKIAVFAGSVGTSGASILTSTAAARAGAGLVYLFADKELYPSIASQLISIMPQRWDPGGSVDEFDPTPYQSLLVGPGWGFTKRRQWLERFIAADVPGIMDADALTILSEIGDSAVDLGGNWVLTPHPGEMSRLSGVESRDVLSDPYSVVSDTAERYNAVVMLKSHVTFIASPNGEMRIVDGMNPVMGTGGAGDVLAGIVAGLLARGLLPFEAASLGALIHDRIGKAAARANGFFLAEDLLPLVSRVCGAPGLDENER